MNHHTWILAVIVVVAVPFLLFIALCERWRAWNPPAPEERFERTTTYQNAESNTQRQTGGGVRPVSGGNAHQRRIARRCAERSKLTAD